jgi:hypothetical protein
MMSAMVPPRAACRLDRRQEHGLASALAEDPAPI